MCGIVARVISNKPLWVFSLDLLHFLYLLYFLPLAASLSLSKKSTPLESSKSSLFCQNTRGGGALQKPPRRISNLQPLFSAPVYDLVNAPAHSTLTTHYSLPTFPLCVSVPLWQSDFSATFSRHSSLATRHFPSAGRQQYDEEFTFAGQQAFWIARTS